MRDLYNLEPISYPFRILPSYWYLIDSTSYLDKSLGLVVGKDLLEILWSAYLNFAYWAESYIRSIKAFKVHDANYEFVSLPYPSFISGRRLSGIVSVGDLPSTRGDINIVQNGDMRIKAYSDSTLYHTEPGLWGWYAGCHIPRGITLSPPWINEYRFISLTTEEDLFNMPSYKIRNNQNYMIIDYDPENTGQCANVWGSTFEITRGGMIPQIAICGFVQLPEQIPQDTTIQLDIIQISTNAPATRVVPTRTIFYLDTTEKEQVLSFQVDNEARVLTICLFPQELVYDGTSYPYRIWLRYVSIKDGQSPNHHIKYDDDCVLNEEIKTDKMFEVDLLNPMIKKYWDVLLGENIVSFTALTPESNARDWVWKESVATNIKLAWRPMVENSLYNLVRGCCAVAFNWFSPIVGKVNRIYPNEENNIWDGGLIEISNDATTIYRRSIISPIFIKPSQGINIGDCCHHNLFDVIAPESVNIYTRIWALRDDTIVNIAGQDDLSYQLRYQPHKFILLHYNDILTMQWERIYEILKYGNKATPPGYEFLLTPCTVPETRMFRQVVDERRNIWSFDTTTNNVVAVSPVNITARWIIGGNLTATQPPKIVKCDIYFYDNDGNLITFNTKQYEFIDEDFSELHLVDVSINLDSKEHIVYNGYIVTRIETLPHTGNQMTNSLFIWEGPLLIISRYYLGNPKIRVWYRI